MWNFKSADLHQIFTLQRYYHRFLLTLDTFNKKDENSNNIFKVQNLNLSKQYCLKTFVIEIQLFCYDQFRTVSWLFNSRGI